MADNSTTDTKMGSDTEMGNPTTVDKGKGKAPQVPQGMEEEEESSEEESGPEEAGGEVEPEDEDNMEEIDTGNIIHSGRTRGKNIDFSKAAEELGDDDEEEDDDDFQDPDDAMEE